MKPTSRIPIVVVHSSQLFYSSFFLANLAVGITMVEHSVFYCIVSLVIQLGYCIKCGAFKETQDM